MRKFFDGLQVWAYLAGFNRLARAIGRFGSEPLNAAGLSENDRPTLPDPIQPVPVIAAYDTRSGPGWSLDEFKIGPLRIVNFDPSFSKNDDIDFANDLSFPVDKYHVN
jgi:hypothetical protein